jgi:hypothetical protein
MSIDKMKKNFFAVMHQKPQDDFELLNFIRLSYIKEEISIIDYRELIKELEKVNKI